MSPSPPEHRGTVGDHGHGVLLDGERKGPLGILLDGLAHSRHPRRVGHGEVVASADGDLAADLDLASKVHQERTVRDIGDLHPGKGPKLVDDALGVLTVPCLDRDIPEDAVPSLFDQIDGSVVATCLSDEHGDAPEHAGTVQDRQAYGEAIRGAVGNGHQCGSRKIPVIYYELFTIGPLLGSCQPNSRAFVQTSN